MRQKMGLEGSRQKTETKAMRIFLIRVMPTSSLPASNAPSLPPWKTRRGTQTDLTSASVDTSLTPPSVIPSTSNEFKYEPPKLERDIDKDHYDDDDNFVEEEARAYGKENFGTVSSPYVYKRRFLVTQYCIFNDIIMVGDSPIMVDTEGDITIKERVFKGSKGLWELLTRKKVNTEFTTKDVLKTFNKILTMTNPNLTRYQPTVTLM